VPAAASVSVAPAAMLADDTESENEGAALAPDVDDGPDLDPTADDGDLSDDGTCAA
jgi:hypothetical protein